MFPHQLRAVYGKLEDMCRSAGIIPRKSGRHMKYPYTYAAKIAQFPIFFFLKNNMFWMYYPPSWIVAGYVFLKIHILVNSEANVQNWADLQRRIAEKEEHEHDH